MDVEELRNRKLFILDMDGTVYLGERFFPGSFEFLDRLKTLGREFLFFTNNASKSKEYYIKKLTRMGCRVERRNILTSGDVTIKYLAENHPGKKVFLVGTPQLEDSFREAGIRLTGGKPDIVVVSFDLTLTYEKISTACRHIREGALFLATHMDLNCPTEDGFIPDCGSICALVTASTGIKPKYFGKPFPETLDMISVITGFRNGDMAVIGDRLYTDIALGTNNGVASVLVLTGETRPGDLERSPVKPDFVFDSIGDIAKIL